MEWNEAYMQRCLQLAKMGAGRVQPNPMVGAVLVYDDTIIGEGFHRQYGGPHAEVNCINSVKPENRHLIQQATLYVSLEPCAHYGKTPPCSLLIIQHKIPKVVIGMQDPFASVNGKGIEQLKQAGVEIVLGVLENECKALNKRFITYHTKKRPYIILKWAQSNNGFIAGKSSDRMYISNELTNRMVHEWRSEEAAILVGRKTAIADNPALTNRYWPGKPQPIRMVIDAHANLPNHLQLLNDGQVTWVWNQHKTVSENNVHFKQWDNKKPTLAAILEACYQENIQSILVEGGTNLLQQLIDAGLWDEARIITNTTLSISDGLKAPSLIDAKYIYSQILQNDFIEYFIPAEHE